MKKTISCLILGLTALTFATTSCEKGDDDPAPATPKTKTQLIAQGTWRFSNATWGGTDITSSLPSCWKDNTMLYLVAAPGNGTGTIDEKTDVCAGQPATTPFTWEFLGGETTLYVSAPIIPGGSTSSTIVSITSTELKLSQPYTVGPVTQPVIVTFIH